MSSQNTDGTSSAADDYTTSRDDLLRRGERLETFSVSWDVLEGIIATIAGFASGSTTLLGYGFESVIEVTAAGTLFWRLRRERRNQGASEHVEQRALRIVGASFFVLAAYVSYDAISKLVQGVAPEFSIVGMGMAAATVVVMPPLALAKRRTVRELGSDALVADSRETIASTYLAVTVLAGLGLYQLFDWAWSDSVAALAMVPYLLWAGVDAWRDATDGGGGSD
ncbi:MAG: cation transporter [Actinomycetota bacterium]